MTTKEHYDKHLGNFYSWMTGDFESTQKEFLDFLYEHGLFPSSTKIALDLGAGHGIQSIPLARLGFQVKAVDFNQQLLDELSHNAKGLGIEILKDDIRNLKQFDGFEPELILCCGDTLSHLDNKKEIETFIAGISAMLKTGGKLLLSFRDYTIVLSGDDRFIPVKSDDTRILTCILDYSEETVRVTDLLYEKTGANWVQKVSSYHKVRIKSAEIAGLLLANGFSIQFNKVISRMTTIIAIKD